VAGDGKETSPPVPASAQRDALDALLGTLTPAALTVPDKLLPLLSAAQNGNDDRQYDIEVFATIGGPVFDPLVAADVAAQVTLDALLAPTRLARVAGQHARDGQALGVDELLDRITAATIDRRQGDLGRRIAYRAIVTLARTARDKKTPPEIGAAIDDRLHGLGERLAKASGDPADRAWSRNLARTLADEKGLDRILADVPHAPTIPPGMPIGGDEGEWMELP
jgi:Met-zincin